MINLLQENKEIESQRTNCTFGFLPTHRQTQKNQKSNFLPTLTELETE
jgi:ubiquitin